MSNLLKAKETACNTITYYHKCPYCGDEPDGYETSVAGEILECICGEKYEVTK